ncbi:Dna2/Cas4 domain-containing protein [Candidatus Woesearchaeota archaeon]|nr:Dna2/Cas4 domain-containing protein [Candidatus Woesearchaeota archaeon]
MTAFDIVIVAGAVVLVVLISLLRRSKVPSVAYKNKPVYSDHREKPVKALFSSGYGLAGKPDFILHTKDGLLPLEIKSSRRPEKPYFSDVMQLTSYCVLLEENGNKPKYGFLQYNSGKTFSVPYTEGLKSHLLKVMAEMRACVEEPRGTCRKCS